jgi:hypothetical protein
MEYFIVLFGIRYDKHWRQAKKVQHNITIATPANLQSTDTPVSCVSAKHHGQLNSAFSSHFTAL